MFINSLQETTTTFASLEPSSVLTLLLTLRAFAIETVVVALHLGFGSLATFHKSYIIIIIDCWI